MIPTSNRLTAVEPADALFAGVDGLGAIRRIVSDAPRWLRPGGWLVTEIGATHGPRVSQLLRASGYEDVEITADAAGRDRDACGRWMSLN